MFEDAKVWHEQECDLSNEQNPWLVGLYRGWNPTQLYRGYNKTIIGMPTNQDFPWKVGGFFFVLSPENDTFQKEFRPFRSMKIFRVKPQPLPKFWAQKIAR